MLLLLTVSAFFSASETAFFNLTPKQIQLLRKSASRLQKLAARLLKHPPKLLSSLLFGNMAVNVFFYAVASVLTVRVEHQLGVPAATVTAIAAFAILVLFGDILPKSIAYANSRPLTIAAALPVLLFVQAFTPLQLILQHLIIQPFFRLFLPKQKQPKAITTTEFKALMDEVRKRGVITAGENRLLAEVIEIRYLKVRHVMKPRVDMTTCSVKTSPATARELMLKNNLTKIPVYVSTIDNIVGLVHLRQLTLQPDSSLDKLVQPVPFVPEQKTVESMLEFFRTTHTDTAIAVDEYGGIAGSIRLENIAEELLGPIEPNEQAQPIEQIGPMKYRLAGDLAVRDWADAFGIDPSETRLATIGGLVSALLGKIPNTGDVACLKNCKFTVEHLHKRRIKTVILTLENIPNNA